MSLKLASAFYNPRTGLARPGSLTHILKLRARSAAVDVSDSGAGAGATPAGDTTLINADAALNTFNSAANLLKAPTRPRPLPPTQFYSPELDLSAFDITVPMMSLRVPVKSTSAIMSLLRHSTLGCSLSNVKTVIYDMSVTAFPLDTTLTAAAADAAGDAAYRRVLLSAEITDYESFLTAAASVPHTAIPAAAATTTTTTAAAATAGASAPDVADARAAALLAYLTSLGCTVVPLELRLSYGFFASDSVLTALLPPTVPIPQAFTAVGHIAHVNLRDEQLPFKHVIGRVLLDKCSGVRTVVNKVGAIDNIYRNFQAEVLAAKSRRTDTGAAFYYYRGSGDVAGSTVAVPGSDTPVAAAGAAAGESNYGYDGSLMTVVREHSSEFEFDFGEVYWNSRLQTEHRRVVQLITLAATTGAAAGVAAGVAAGAGTCSSSTSSGAGAGGKGQQKQKQGQGKATAKPAAAAAAASAAASSASAAPAVHLLDPFAGVGPFAVPAAQGGCAVWGADLNPKSALYLYRNSRRNRVEQRLRVLNADARALVRATARQQLLQAVQRLLQRPPGAALTAGALPPTAPAGAATPPAAGSAAAAGAGPLERVVPWFDHVIMNLPASAVTFLDVFNGLYTPDGGDMEALLAEYPSLPKEFFGPAHAEHYAATAPAALAPWVLAPATAAPPPPADSRVGLSADQDPESAPAAAAAAAAARAQRTGAGIGFAAERLCVHREWADALALVSQPVSAPPAAAAAAAAAELVTVSTDALLRRLRLDTASDAAESAPLAAPVAAAVRVSITRAHLRAAGWRAPTVHCYCFARCEDDWEGDAIRMAEQYLGYRVASAAAGDSADPAAYFVDAPAPSAAPMGAAKQGLTASVSAVSQLPFQSQSSDAASVPPSLPTSASQWSLDVCTDAATAAGSAAPALPAGKELFYQAARRNVVQRDKRATTAGNGSGSSAVAPTAGLGVDVYDLGLMQRTIDAYGVYVHDVRNVAPLKQMMCVSFRLREDTLFGLNSESKGKKTPSLISLGIVQRREVGDEEEGDDAAGEQQEEAVTQTVKRPKVA